MLVLYQLTSVKFNLNGPHGGKGLTMLSWCIYSGFHLVLALHSEKEVEKNMPRFSDESSFIYFHFTAFLKQNEAVEMKLCSYSGSCWRTQVCYFYNTIMPEKRDGPMPQPQNTPGQHWKSGPDWDMNLTIMVIHIILQRKNASSYSRGLRWIALITV